MSRARRKPAVGPAHYLAPVAFLAAVTVAVLLVHSGLQGGRSPAATTAVSGARATTARTGTTAAPAKRVYTVRSGDTLGSIAGKVGVPVARLQALNPGVSPDSLQVGQRLRIK